MQEAHIILEAFIQPAQPGTQEQEQGHEARVTVITGGTSKNGYAYNDSALQEIARLIEGAHAYADHARTSADLAVRSIRDVVGFYHNAQLVPAQDNAPARVDADLHIFEAADWLWSLIQESIAINRPELVGLSVDLMGTWAEAGANKIKHVERVLSLNSCDIVTKPSAGGALQRILHSDTTNEEGHSTMPEDQNHNQETSTTTSSNTQGQPEQPQTTSSQSNQGNQEAQRLQENINAQLAAAQAEATAQAARITEQQTAMNTLMQQLKLERAQLDLERRLLESVLPEPARALVRSRFAGRVFESAELEAEILAQTTMLATLASQGLIRGHNFEKPDIGSQITEAEKIQAAFDKMFDLDIDTKFGTIRGFSSIKEAYARVTGDSSLSGGFTERSQVGSIRVTESAPVTRITEADTTTASFSFLLGTSMNKRLLKDYQAWPAEWMKFCSIAPIRDFKQQTRVRFGAFGSLPVVPEDTAYQAVTLIDSAATYVPQKRGNLVTVSRETIINDDLQAIKQIPTKLAVAAAYTLAEFVYGFLINNPNIYDGNTLFTVGAPHSNQAANALASAAVQTGVTSMREQTNYAGKRIGLRPRFLIVPPELEWTSMVITKSAGAPGGNNNDINPMLGYVTPIISPQLTSATAWFMAADPREVDTIEIGFVGGQINPALFIQDQPLFGLNFSQDAITYKIRHEYGGAAVDYRGLYKGN